MSTSWEVFLLDLSLVTTFFFVPSLNHKLSSSFGQTKWYFCFSFFSFLLAPIQEGLGQSTRGRRRGDPETKDFTSAEAVKYLRPTPFHLLRT
ncbi:uncharacterized protein BO66DRAFT_2590 [Aspergillus aculeatinus CBS 121060]|uniref:Uncharacterized protein n=1 Tax=Aspergillus aculeatinus CBS 121060 TaxID=1448322 RepID=A0ACD1HPC7_9EURO|nr:hypothetical protein BO66DRAFT_2590 [Aspergillus aculeatinus CBS 121060]RAH75208.1 hypothetical protein BO66DRAFT_2590 [Aspergillus aculeatinus CBS 121060]